MIMTLDLSGVFFEVVTFTAWFRQSKTSPGTGHQEMDYLVNHILSSQMSFHIC